MSLPIHLLAARTGSLFPVVLGLVVLVLAGALGALFAAAARRFGPALVPVIAYADSGRLGRLPRRRQRRRRGGRAGAREGGLLLNSTPAFLLVGVLGGMLGLAVFSIAQGELHPADLPAFDRREQVSLRRDTRDGRGIAQNQVTVSFPAAVRIDDDFTVEVDGSLQRVRDSSGIRSDIAT